MTLIVNNENKNNLILGTVRMVTEFFSRIDYEAARELGKGGKQSKTKIIQLSYFLSPSSA